MIKRGRGGEMSVEQLDLFFADVMDPSLRDQQDIMTIPFFSLEKRKREKPIHYKRAGVEVTVRGLMGVGVATIWDADFIIWAASQLNEAVERGEQPTRRLWVIPYHFLVQTKRMNPATRGGGGAAYRRFEDSLRRLHGTTIETNIKAAGEHVTRAWSWIDYWESHRDEKGRIKGVEVVLSDWFFSRVVKDRSILAISSEYFLLTGGIERWLYRIARKHCGNNEIWSMSVKILYEKYSPGREFRKFKMDLKGVVERDCLPEYHTTWNRKVTGIKEIDYVIFMLREGTREARKMPRFLREKPERP